MLDWSNLQHFLALATSGSLPTAAERLGVNRTTVSRRVADLEAELGTALFERQGRNLVLTEAGREVLDVAESVNGSLDGLSRSVFGRDRKLEGRIRFTTTPGLARVLTPEVAAFALEHPQVIMELTAAMAALNLDLREADVAVRLTDSPPETLIGRKVADLHFAVYANPATAQRLSFATLAQWKARGEPFIGWITPPDHTLDKPGAANLRAASNDADMHCELVAAGVGVAEIPCYIGESDPRLVRVSAPLPKYQAWLLYPPQLRTVRRIQVFVESLLGAFERLQPVFNGTSGNEAGLRSTGSG